MDVVRKTGNETRRRWGRIVRCVECYVRKSKTVVDSSMQSASRIPSRLPACAFFRSCVEGTIALLHE